MNAFKKIFVFACALFLSACAHQHDVAETPKFVEPRFKDALPITLEVGSIEVVSEFVPSFERPNVEHLFPVSIEKSARIWASDRLEVTGKPSDRTAKFIIKDASVVEEKIEAEQLFYKDNLRYKAMLSVVLQITAPDGKSQTNLDTWREITIPVDTSVEDKERAWSNMTNKLMEEFDKRMEQNIRRYLNMYVKNEQVVLEY